jgi:hypothetical protein
LHHCPSHCSVLQVELVGPVCPLQVVTSRYAAHNQLLAARLASLEGAWPSCRLVAGDGNCFFRGYLFGMLEALLAHADLALHHRCVWVCGCGCTCG